MGRQESTPLGSVDAQADLNDSTAPDRGVEQARPATSGEEREEDQFDALSGVDDDSSDLNAPNDVDLAVPSARRSRGDANNPLTLIDDGLAMQLGLPSRQQDDATINDDMPAMIAIPSTQQTDANNESALPALPSTEQTDAAPSNGVNSNIGIASRPPRNPDNQWVNSIDSSAPPASFFVQQDDASEESDTSDSSDSSAEPPSAPSNPRVDFWSPNVEPNPRSTSSNISSNSSGMSMDMPPAFAQSNIARLLARLQQAQKR